MKFGCYEGEPRFYSDAELHGIAYGFQELIQGLYENAVRTKNYAMADYLLNLYGKRR